MALRRAGDQALLTCKHHVLSSLRIWYKLREGRRIA